MKRIKGVSACLVDSNFSKRDYVKTLKIYINHKRQRVTFNTDLKIDARFFNIKSLSVSHEHVNSDEINSKIESIYKFYYERFIFLKESGLPITKESFNDTPKIKINSRVKFNSLNGSSFSDIDFIDFNFLTLNAIKSPKLNSHYVYLLILNNIVMYVGKTEKNLLRRLERHQYDKSFDSFIFFETDPTQTNIIEALLIRKYNPHFNKVRF